jgi:hypothetical protein
MKKKLIVALVLLLSMVLMVPSVFAASDLPEDHRFYEEITYLMDKEIMTGYSNGTVKPERNVTRAEAAIMIARYNGYDGAQQTTPFTDVPKSHPASGYIAQAAKAGLISGYDDKSYKPDAPIIRGDMAIIIQRVFDLGLLIHSDFTDVSGNMKASGPIENLVAANITIGYPDRTFRPLQNVTRGQFAAFLARGMEPKFRNDATIPDSYLRDKTKVYVTQGNGEKVTHTYQKHAINDSYSPEFMWISKSQKTGMTTATVELENYDEYVIGFPYSEGFTFLAFPVKVGKKFVNEFIDMETPVTHTITAVNKTVKTPYKTFTNATEVTDEKGGKYYYVEGHGSVKTLDASGKVLSELVEIR